MSSGGSSICIGQADFSIEQFDAPDGAVTVRVLGDLDLSSSPALRATLDRLAATGQRTVLDLSATDFMDCSGLAVVLHAARVSAGSGPFTLAPERSAPVARLIALAGVGDALTDSRTA